MLIAILSYLIIYLPIHYIFGHSSIFAIILLFFIFMIIEIISYYIMRYRNIRYGNIIGLGIIIVMYIIFGYLTYYPIEIDLFYDDSKNVYGIPK